MKYSGIDLHSNNSVVTVIDETDKFIAEKRLPNDLAKILAFLAEAYALKSPTSSPNICKHPVCTV